MTPAEKRAQVASEIRARARVAPYAEFNEDPYFDEATWVRFALPSLVEMLDDIEEEHRAALRAAHADGYEAGRNSVDH